MPLITKPGLDDVYKALKNQFNQIRAQSVRLRQQTAAGSVSFTTVKDYFEFLNSSTTYCDLMVSKYGGSVLQAYARSQEDSTTYNPTTEYISMKNAVTAIVNHITTTLPANSTHTISNGIVNEPVFTSVQTTTLRGLLDTLIGTIDAP